LCLVLWLGGAAMGVEGALDVRSWLDWSGAATGSYRIARPLLPRPTFHGTLEVVSGGTVLWRREVSIDGGWPDLWFEAPTLALQPEQRWALRLTGRCGETPWSALWQSSEDNRPQFRPGRYSCLGMEDTDFGAPVICGNCLSISKAADAPARPDASLKDRIPATTPVWRGITAYNGALAPASTAGWSTLSGVLWVQLGAAGYSPDSLAALFTWVRQGGKLILVDGDAELHSHPSLAPFDPVRLIGHLRIAAADLAAVGPPQTALGQGIAHAQLRPGARLVAGTRDRPLVAERPLGLGAVDFVASTALMPWAWDLLAPAPAMGSYSEHAIYLAPLSFAQLRSPAPSRGLLIGGLLAYVLLLIPLLGLSRRQARRERSALLVPLFVVACTTAVYLAGEALRPHHAVERTVSLVDVAAGERVGVAETMTALYAPRPSSFDLTMPPGMVLRDEPNYGTNPNHRTTHTPPLITAAGPDERTATVAVGQGSVRRIGYRQDAEIGPVSLDVELGSDAGNATVTNRGAETLYGAMLWVGDDAVTVGDLRTGETRRVEWATDGSAQAKPADDPRFAARNGLIFPTSQFFRNAGSFAWLGHYRGGPESGAELLAWSDDAAEAPLAKPAIGDRRALRIIRVHGEPQLAVGRVTVRAKACCWDISRNDGEAPSTSVRLPGVADGARCVSLVIADPAPGIIISGWDWAARAWVPWDAALGNREASRFVDPMGRVRLGRTGGKPVDAVTVIVTATLEH